MRKRRVWQRVGGMEGGEGRSLPLGGGGCLPWGRREEGWLLQGEEPRAQLLQCSASSFEPWSYANLHATRLCQRGRFSTPETMHATLVHTCCLPPR